MLQLAGDKKAKNRKTKSEYSPNFHGSFIFGLEDFSSEEERVRSPHLIRASSKYDVNDGFLEYLGSDFRSTFSVSGSISRRHRHRHQRNRRRTRFRS